MKFTFEFEHDETELDIFNQMDLAMRMFAGGIKLSLISTGITQDQIASLSDLLGYTAIERTDDAQITIECPIEKLMDKLDELDIDPDELRKCFNTLGAIFN